MPRVVLDNGSWEIRAGVSEAQEELEDNGAYHPPPLPRVVSPNCTARPRNQLRVLVADEMYTLKNLAQLEFSRPLQRGLLVNAGCEHDVWRRVIESTAAGVGGAGCGDRKAGLGVSALDSTLVCSEAACAVPSSQRALDELIFEDFEFESAAVAPAGWLASRAEPVVGAQECVVVVDCGHAATNVVPILKDGVAARGVRRLDVGGKVLTGYLRELVSYRQYNMMDETMVLDHVKRSLAYVAMDFRADLAAVDGTTQEHGRAGPFYAEYVLPDYHHIQEGFPRLHAHPPDRGLTTTKASRPRRTRTDAAPQFLRLESERFCVPELLFNPQDIGLPQAGLPALIADALQVAELHHAHGEPLAARVVLSGAGAALPGLEARLASELRALLPETRPLAVQTHPNPALATYQGAHAVAHNESLYTARATTRADYLEHGHRSPRAAQNAYDARDDPAPDHFFSS